MKDPTGLVAQRGSVELGSGRKLLQGQVQLVTLLHLTFIVKVCTIVVIVFVPL